MTVWMANYLTGVRRERTAALEWNHHGDFVRMGEFCGCRTKQGGGNVRDDGTAGESFRLLDVDYYADAGAGELASCLNGDYRRIIVDYGEITGASIVECARCDRKIIVGALSEWQADAFLEEVNRHGKRDISWRYAAAFGSEETRKRLEKTFCVDCMRIPASADAFAVTRADMDFFENLLRIF